MLLVTLATGDAARSKIATPVLACVSCLLAAGRSATGEPGPALVGVSMPVTRLAGVSTRTDDAAVSGRGPGKGKSFEVICRDAGGGGASLGCGEAEGVGKSGPEDVTDASGGNASDRKDVARGLVTGVPPKDGPKILVMFGESLPV